MAQNHYENNKLDEMIDPDLRIQMAPASLRTYSTVAYRCLKNRKDDRPTMRLVVEELEKALGHQQGIEWSRRHKGFSGYSHDVCISFRKDKPKDGHAIALGHVNVLCKAFETKGLSVYKDNIYHDQESLPLEAIEQSRSSVIVFTSHFAGSSCCLDEVVKIMECQNERNQVVMPMYYKMEESDVRAQSGDFRDAFLKFTDNKRIGVWRNALVMAANIQGGFKSYGYSWGEKVLEAASSIKDQLSDKAALPALPGFSHDVCISFRKDELEAVLVDTLCKALEKKGLSVYKDNIYNTKESLPLEAIEQSRSSIILFSTYFASSSWCLDEAVKIMECVKERKHVVLPIYYQVKESDVKNFFKVESRETLRKFKKTVIWMNALDEAAAIEGRIKSSGWAWGEKASEIASRIKDQLSGVKALRSEKADVAVPIIRDQLSRELKCHHHYEHHPECHHLKKNPGNSS